MWPLILAVQGHLAERILQPQAKLSAEKKEDREIKYGAERFLLRQAPLIFIKKKGLSLLVKCLCLSFGGSLLCHHSSMVEPTREYKMYLLA